MFWLFTDAATTEYETYSTSLSLHDALPIFGNQVIDRPFPRNSRLDSSHQRGLVSNIEGQDQRALSLWAAIRRHFGQPRLVATGQHQLRPPLRPHARQCRTDPARSTGDPHYLPGIIHRRGPLPTLLS